MSHKYNFRHSYDNLVISMKVIFVSKNLNQSKGLKIFDECKYKQYYMYSFISF